MSALAVSLGEPGGIGPDVALKAWAALNSELVFAVIGDAGVLRSRAGLLNLDMAIAEISDMSEAADVMARALPVLHQPLDAPCQTGKADAAHAGAVIRAIDTAVDLSLSGEAAGMVTCPIQKNTLYSAGFKHQGHTDYIADVLRNRGHKAEPVMMLIAGELRTVPLTIHIALADVPKAITFEQIETAVRVITETLRMRFDIAQARIGVTGLNPHAGEDGSMGREEIEVIAPAIERLRADGYTLAGPLPADTVFHGEARAAHDAILCMYHDQALIPVKTIGFHECVNMTLGLPIVRTSPDHGTALSLAGTGKANPSSMISALRLTRQLTARAPA